MRCCTWLDNSAGYYKFLFYTALGLILYLCDIIINLLDTKLLSKIYPGNFNVLIPSYLARLIPVLFLQSLQYAV